MVVSIVIVDAKANPFAASCRRAVDGPGDEVDLVGIGEETTAPAAQLAAGAADNRHSAGGLINAIALRWRTNLGSFG
jgi:hypothetical protein